MNVNERKGGRGITAVKTVTLDLVADDFRFDKKTITVPSGAAVTIKFDNKDDGIPHNFALYRSADANETIFQGEIITGPDRITYRYTAPSEVGKYFFRCDVHPTLMTGTFIVQ